MSRDPFEIGKIDSKKSIGQGQGASPLANLGQNAALARVGEGAGGGTNAPAAPPAAPQSDRVQFSPEVDDAPNTGVSNNLLAAWSSPPASKVDKAGEAQAISGNFNMTQVPPPGMAGGVIGAGGAVHGQGPGMQAGGVFTTPRVNAA